VVEQRLECERLLVALNFEHGLLAVHVRVSSRVALWK
jgi:hypothetical protein